MPKRERYKLNAGAKLRARVNRFKEAAAFLGTKDEKKLAHNTYIYWIDENHIGVVLHNTRIVTFSRDGDITLNSGGYQTVTTKARINALLPVGYRLWQDRHQWYIRHEDWPYPMEFTDNMVVHESGRPPFHPHAINPMGPYGFIKARKGHFTYGNRTHYNRNAMQQPWSEEALEEIAQQAIRGRPVFDEGDVGTWIDGAYGEAHAIDKMRELLAVVIQAGIRNAEVTALEAEDVNEGDEFVNEWFDEATEVLQSVTAPGLVWYWEAGDLILLPEEELD